jgi:hypothetical protein
VGGGLGGFYEAPGSLLQERGGASSVRQFRVQREIGRRSGGLVDQAVVDGVERQLQTVGHT